MITTQRLKAIAFASLLLTGCTKAPDNAVKELEGAMKAFAAQATKWPRDGEIRVLYGYPAVAVLTNFTFDVRKTDSLVSPYLGIVKYTLDGEPIEALFAYQDKQWILKDLCIECPTSYTKDDKKAPMKRYCESEGIEAWVNAQWYMERTPDLQTEHGQWEQVLMLKNKRSK
jgi:hypothetical protein